MNIIKHGAVASMADVKTFKCGQCGCEFTADYDEYYLNKGSCFTSSSSLSYTYSTKVTDVYACSCPECHKIVTKEEERTIETPCITATYGTGTSNG